VAKGRAAGEPGGGDVREGGGERERFWGEGRLTGRAHRGGEGSGGPTVARTVRVAAGGGRLGH
jgi:hypothetical protein